MKKILNLSLSLLFLVSIVSFAKAQSTITIELPYFHEIELDISANVTIKQGKTQKIEVSGPTELIDLLNKEVKGEKWEIKYTKRNVKNKKSLEIMITVVHLDEIELNGSGDIIGATALHEDEIEISVNGSGSIEFEIYTEDLEISINGSGNVNLNGTAEKCEIDINGSGSINAEELTVENAEFSVNGSGDTRIHVTKKLSANLNGSGDIHYLGSPDIKLNKNGSGDIKIIDN